MKKIDKSVRVVQREKISQNFEIKEFKWTERQIEIIKQLLNKENKIIFISGPAGSSKTLLSVLAALKYLQEKRVSELLYVRTVIESASKSLGFLPGAESDKFKPFIIPLEDKLHELLNKLEIDRLFKEDRIKCLPVNFLRGSSFNSKFIIADETQNFTYKELVTLITRIGQFSKMILVGDTMQSDVNGNSGFKQIIDIFDNEDSRKQGIIHIKLSSEDIMRSGIVRYIVETLEKVKH
jgi:phosphate starvation-inducible PhoH-like protein